MSDIQKYRPAITLAKKPTMQASTQNGEWCKLTDHEADRKADRERIAELTDKDAIWAAAYIKLEGQIAELEDRIKKSCCCEIEDGKVVEYCKMHGDKITALEADIKVLLSFAPDKPPEGLDPTFYHTLTYEGDLEIWKRIQKIKEGKH